MQRPIPLEYIGREQTYLKHRVLQEYAEQWAHKLASRVARLWYVDCFAGPWQSGADDRSDTSIAIGLRALNDAAASWSRIEDRTIEVHAVFVEKSRRAFAELETFAPTIAGGVRLHLLLGTFGEHVAEIDRIVGGDAAFVFVDPTGWNGAAMDFVAKVANRRGRDVLINVMYDHLNRFKDDERQFLRDQMREFFGLGDDALPAGLGEEALLALYRNRLRERGWLDHVADLAIPVPTKERTNFRLVVGGHHPAVLQVFRDVEERVIGREAAEVRSAAKERQTGQLALLGGASDHAYEHVRREAERRVREELPGLLRVGPRAFAEVWPVLMERHHVTHTALKQLVWAMREDGRIAIGGLEERQRTVHDEHVLSLPITSDSPS